MSNVIRLPVSKVIRVKRISVQHYNILISKGFIVCLI